MQNRKVFETCNKIIYENLGKWAAVKKFKLHNWTGNAKNTMVNIAMAKKEELDEAHHKDSECKCPDFAISERNDFYYGSFTGSPMCSLGLGLVCSITPITYQFASLLDVKKEFIASVKNNKEFN